jgi:hypothetical protein
MRSRKKGTILFIWIILHHRDDIEIQLSLKIARGFSQGMKSKKALAKKLFVWLKPCHLLSVIAAS